MKYQTFFLLAVALVACGDDDGLEDSGTPLDATTDTTADTTPQTDAGPEMCEMPGATRNAVCGMCGMQAQLCESGVWSPQSECLGQGECNVGDVDTEDTPMCGRRQRLCLDGCTWGDWDVLEEDGECAAGETEMRACADGVLVPHVCGDECAWSAGDACMTECGLREALPIDDPLMERICIPAGPTTIFYEGSDGERASRSPTLSAFWIMKHPVANRLYSTCEECGEPVLGGPRLSDEPGWAVHVQPVGDARSFCESVGASLITLAQLTRAARGDCGVFAPYPWSACDAAAATDEPSCETMVDCFEDCATDANSVCSPLSDELPASAFGVQRLMGPGVRVLVDDGYTPDLGAEYDGADPNAVGNGTVLLNEFGGLRRNTFTATFRCVWEAE